MKDPTEHNSIILLWKMLYLFMLFISVTVQSPSGRPAARPHVLYLKRVSFNAQ